MFRLKGKHIGDTWVSESTKKKRVWECLAIRKFLAKKSGSRRRRLRAGGGENSRKWLIWGNKEGDVKEGCKKPVLYTSWGLRSLGTLRQSTLVTSNLVETFRLNQHCEFLGHMMSGGRGTKRKLYDLRATTARGNSCTRTPAVREKRRMPTNSGSFRKMKLQNEMKKNVRRKRAGTQARGKEASD